jgi:hypothetical protein
MTKKNKGPKSLIKVSSEKQPTSLQAVSRSKIPRTNYADDAMKMKPSWRISFVRTVEPWGWHSLTGDELQEVHTKLCEYESKTWSEILVQEQYRNHQVECYKLCKEAQDQLSELELDDLEQLVSLRLSARQRVWGILDHHILHLLWWDPEHLICPSLKKHT